MRHKNGPPRKCPSNLIVAFLFWMLAGISDAAPFLYVNSDQRQFGVVDLATGAYTHRGLTPDVLLGLGINNGTVYGIDTLDRLDFHRP